MTVTNPIKIDAYADISFLAYNNNPTVPHVPGPGSSSYFEIAQDITDPFDLGFQGRAFFYTTENELVIAFTGRELTDNVAAIAADLVANLALAATGTTTQMDAARDFIELAKGAADAA